MADEHLNEDQKHPLTIDLDDLPEPAPCPPPQEALLWSGWDAWVLLGIAIAGSIFSSFLCQLGYLLFRGAFHWPVLGIDQLSKNAYFVLAVQFLLYVVLVSFLFLLITHKYALDFYSSVKLVRISREDTKRFIYTGVAMAFAVMLLSTLLPSARETPLEKIFGQGRAIYFFAFFGIVVAPFTEELIFRGFLFPVFEKLGGKGVAVVGTALIFAGLHVPQLWGSWAAMGLILFVGFILSGVRAVTGLLTPSWLVHLTYNSTLVLAVLSAKFMAPLAHSIR
jgi:membrane protease YdiL (CAAX protease family)